ncbi:MIF4G like-domain-containing protein [Lipomyces oligophaga]|uniref:MIF4G like-domain-containing protein n=1 Tax=Lipomyces oligophaga TaxID=45792 RepID=UPI0034CECE9E
MSSTYSSDSRPSNNKRRRDSDSQNDRPNYRYRNERHRFHERNRDRNRDSDRQSSRLKSDFYRIKKTFLSLDDLDPNDSYETSIKRIASTIVNRSSILEDEELATATCEFLRYLAIEQPAKMLAAIPCLINISSLSPALGSTVLNSFVKNTQISIDQGDWNQAKLFIRLLIRMSSIIKGNPAIDLLHAMISKAIELQNSSDDQNQLAVAIYRTVLLSIPYIVLSDSSADSREQAESLFEQAKSFKYTTPKSLPLLSHFVNDEAPYKCTDSLNLLISQLNNLSEAEWKLDLLPSLLELPDDFEKLEIDAIELPEKLVHNSSNSAQMFYKFFTNSRIESTPPLEKIESTIFRDLLNDSLNYLSYNREAVSRHILSIDKYFLPTVFAEQEISLEKLAQITNGSTWKPEDIVMEAILANLFALPKSCERAVFYHCVLIQACTDSPHAMGPVFGRAIRFLYDNLEHLDYEVIFRFLDWFSHHLSNFGFTWKWNEWIADMGLDRYHPKRVFISELVGKELRFSFPQRIRELLPEQLQGLVYDDQEEPEFTYAAAGGPYAEQAKSVLQLLKDRSEVSQYENVFNEIRQSAEESSDSSADEMLRKIFLSAVLSLGSRSLSHAESWIERSQEVLNALFDTANAQQEAVGIVFTFWGEQIGSALQVVRKLLDREIISPLALVEWVLVSQTSQVLTKVYSWELLEFAVNKCRVNYSKPDVEVEMEKSGSRDKDLELILIAVIRELSRTDARDLKLGDTEPSEDSVRWLRWWKEGMLRAFLRKYNGDYKSIQQSLKDLGLTDTTVLKYLEQAIEL